MTCHDKAAFLQELIRVYRCMRAGIPVTDEEHAWVEQEASRLQKHQIAEAMRGDSIEEIPEIQFPDDSTPGGGGG